jgi:hypothetical protein
VVGRIWAIVSGDRTFFAVRAKDLAGSGLISGQFRLGGARLATDRVSGAE